MASSAPNDPFSETFWKRLSAYLDVLEVLHAISKSPKSDDSHWKCCHPLDLDIVECLYSV